MLELLAVPGVVRVVRRAVRRYVGEGSAGAAQLCVSELLANVILHVGEGAPATVRVAETGCGRVRVAVTDPVARGVPEVRGAAVARPAGCDEESGRGLALLDAVAVRWGVERCGDGKTVWCEVAAGPVAGRAACPAPALTMP